jgi:hypothetical protein
VSTIAGSGVAGYADGVATQATFNRPYGIGVDMDDTLYVCDYNNHKIRKISKQGMEAGRRVNYHKLFSKTLVGIVETIAGSSAGYQDGIGTSAKFNRPWNISIDSNKNILVADYGNHRIRKITPQGI